MVDFQSMFMETKGQPVTYNGHLIHMVDKLAVSENQELFVVFQSVSSDWRQGVHLSTVGEFEVGGQMIKKSIVLWRDTAPEEVRLIVKSRDGVCNVKNVWDVGDGVMHSWHGGAAMRICDGIDGRTYRCNDGRDDDDFDDLVFRIERFG